MSPVAQQRYWNRPTPEALEDTDGIKGLDAPTGPPEVRTIDLRLIVIALVIGVAFDLAVHRRVTSVASLMLVVTLSGGLLLSGRLVTPQSRILVALAPLFALFFVLRMSLWLTLPNLLVTYGLLVLGASTSNRVGMRGLGLRDLILMPLRLVGDSLQTPQFLLRGIGKVNAQERRNNLISIFFGLTLALPVVGLLGLLLVSGDALSASLLNTVAQGGILSHLLVSTVGLVGALVLLFRAARSDRDPLPPNSRFLGEIETIIILGAVVLLYSAFALLQLVGALGAADRILSDIGDTKDWARSGFFSLLWAAGLTLTLQLVLDVVTAHAESAQKCWYRRLSVAVSGLTLVLVGLSVYRIAAYSQAYGLTMLRTYSAVFALWVGVVFVFAALRVVRGSWFAEFFWTASIGTGLFVLLFLNIANPEAIVARYNTTRSQSVDVQYLYLNLSEDAVPELVAALPSMSEQQAAQLTDGLCRGADLAGDDWLSWNRSRSRGQESLRMLCVQ
jgi:Domain of unknown function (DUF4153)